MSSRTIQGSIGKNIAHGAVAGFVAGKLVVLLMMLATIFGNAARSMSAVLGMSFVSSMDTSMLLSLY